MSYVFCRRHSLLSKLTKKLCKIGFRLPEHVSEYWKKQYKMPSWNGHFKNVQKMQKREIDLPLCFRLPIWIHKKVQVKTFLLQKSTFCKCKMHFENNVWIYFIIDMNFLCELRIICWHPLSKISTLSVLFMQGSRQPTISDGHLFYTKKRLFFKNMPLNFDFIWNPDIRHSMQGTPHISWGNGRTLGGLTFLTFLGFILSPN